MTSESTTEPLKRVPNRSNSASGATGAIPAPRATSAVAETVAAVFGMAGAFLLASTMHPGLGFAAFLVSNVGGLAFTVRGRYWRLFLQQCVFLVSSLVGLWNWWLGPLVIGGAR